MKTVIQEYTEYILNIIRDAQDNDLSLEWLKSKIEDDVVYDYLLKEKQQISQAFDFGYDRDDISGDEYYNNTYKTVSK